MEKKKSSKLPPSTQAGALAAPGRSVLGDGETGSPYSGGLASLRGTRGLAGLGLRVEVDGFLLTSQAFQSRE